MSGAIVDNPDDFEEFADRIAATGSLSAQADAVRLLREATDLGDAERKTRTAPLREQLQAISDNYGWVGRLKAASDRLRQRIGERILAELAERERIARDDPSSLQPAPKVDGLVYSDGWEAHVVDPGAVPREHCVPDPAALAALAKGRKARPPAVPGVEWRRKIRVTVRGC